MRFAAALGSAATLALGFAATAAAQTVDVGVQYQSFAPTSIDALPGDVVTWDNSSSQTHTVTADDDAFDSGDLAPGQSFSTSFATTGVYTYHCVIHRGMTGEIDVRRVTLDALPPNAIVKNANLAVSGRTADAAHTVEIQADTGTGFVTVASAAPGADGTWSASIRATKTGRYRAVSGADLSETRRLLVIEQTVKLQVKRSAISVTVTPSAPYQLVALQFRLKDRFGWWTVDRRRLNYVSSTIFRLSHSRHVLARVVLLGPDHWTPVALSKPFLLNRH
jgi:plastocyanin